MLNTQKKIWSTTLYLRLSRDDGDKEESGSITGQRELLRDYISQHPELREYAIRIDDGFSGSTFERPGFQKMIFAVVARAARMRSAGAQHTWVPMRPPETYTFSCARTLSSNTVLYCFFMPTGLQPPRT